jgi:hypothetical protein
MGERECMGLPHPCKNRRIPPQSDTRVLPGDHVTLVIHHGVRSLTDRVFGRGEAAREELPALFEFPLRGSATVRELEDFYAVRMDVPPQCTLDEAIRGRLGKAGASAGRRVDFGPVAFYVRSVRTGRSSAWGWSSSRGGSRRVAAGRAPG